MELYTIQMGKWRVAKELAIPLYNITIKSGDSLFAPSWAILNNYRNNGDIEAREKIYIEAYTAHMRDSYKKNRSHWLDLLNMDVVAITCYCGKGKFCHRTLLVEIIRKVCAHELIEFKYLGELG